MQQGDIHLYQTENDGEISIENGIIEMNGGLETSVYLSMFGGNLLDSGGSDTTLEWWGNKTETLDSKKYRSETQYVLSSTPATVGNMINVKDSVGRDLAWLMDEGVVSSIDIEIRLPALNTVGITITIEANGNESEFTYVENWKVN